MRHGVPWVVCLVHESSHSFQGQADAVCQLESQVASQPAALAGYSSPLALTHTHIQILTVIKLQLKCDGTNPSKGDLGTPSAGDLPFKAVMLLQATGPAWQGQLACTTLMRLTYHMITTSHYSWLRCTGAPLFFTDYSLLSLL